MLRALKAESDAIIRDAEAFDRRAKALEARLEVLKPLATEAVVAVTEAEVAELRAEAESLRRREQSLEERVPALADMPGVIGWVARRHWVWGVVGSVGAGGLLAVALAVRVHGVRLGFVEAAAQVLPVLLIAVALQGRYIETMPKTLPPVILSYLLAYLGWMVAGEAAALVGVAMGRAAPVVVGVTATSSAFALFTLVIVLSEAVRSRLL